MTTEYPNGLVPLHGFVNVAGAELNTFEFMGSEASSTLRLLIPGAGLANTRGQD